MFPLGWVSELKTDRARYASASSSYYRPCGFLATLGVIGLVGALAAPTGAAAAMFTMKEDYGYGAMTGGYREKHVRKSRGDGNAKRAPWQGLWRGRRGLRRLVSQKSFPPVQTRL